MSLLHSIRLRRRWIGEVTRLALGRLPRRCETLGGAGIALVSRYVPRSPSGWPIVLENLLEPLPPESVVVVGEGHDPWPGRVTLPLPSRRLSLWRARVGGALDRGVRRLEQRVLAQRFGREARSLGLVFGAFDDTLPLAEAIARAAGARFWVLALDDHADPAAHASILRRADRVFAVTREQAVNVAARYGLPAVPEELLQMTALPGPPPPPHATGVQGPMRLVLLGNVYDYHEPALRALHDAASRKPGLLSLTVVAPPGVSRRAWVPAAWEWRQGRHNDVWGDLREADAGIVMLTDDPASVMAMRVAHPVKFRDYLCMGLPVLAIVPRPSFVTRIIDSEGVGVTPTLDPGSIDAALARLVDPAMRAEMRRKARAFAERCYDISTSGFLRELREILTRSPGAAERAS